MMGTYIYVKRVPVKLHTCRAFVLRFALLLSGQRMTTWSQRVLLILLLWLLLGGKKVQQMSVKELLVHCNKRFDAMFR